MTYMMSGHTVRLNAGQSMLFWAATPHQMIARDDTTLMHIVNLSPGWVVERQLPERLTKPLLNGEPLFSRCAQHDFAASARWQRDLRLSAEHKLALALELEAFLRRFALDSYAMEASSTLPRRNRHAELMATHIANNFADALTVDDIANLLHLHPNYAMRIFHDAFGVSIHAYLIQHRVAFAQQMLATTDLDVLTVALRSGFGSASQFYAVFKHICGMPPRAYRKSLVG